jgi:hypothetical protein
MTTESTTTPKASASSTGSTSSTTSTTSSSDARDAVGAAASEVRGALENVSRSMPEVARASRTMMDDAFRAIERGSDERVSSGVTLSLGLAIGMLIGGAPRLLTVLALVPVAAMGLVLVDRRSRTTGATATGSRSTAG